MTTPPPTQSAGREIPAVHAGIASPAVLLRERRMLYQLAAEMLEGNDGGGLAADVLDSPLARNRIGDALAGRASLVCSELAGINAVAGNGVREAGCPRVISRPDANTRLAAALDTVMAEMGRQEATCGSLRLLTEADGERFISAVAALDHGVTLARSVSPELIDDLLAHIALVGIVNPQHAGRLASASSRKFPGLVLLESPRSEIEAAEALVHEGAHQKLFDLAITRDFLDVDSDRCRPFHPPWAQGRSWPLEQTLAACHAYACLARFADDANVAAGGVRPGTVRCCRWRVGGATSSGNGCWTAWIISGMTRTLCWRASWAHGHETPVPPRRNPPSQRQTTWSQPGWNSVVVAHGGEP